MVGWWLILFGLSVMTFLDTFFGVGASIREMTSVALLLCLLGLMTRISRKTRKGEREDLIAQVAQLERELHAVQMKNSPQIASRPSPDQVPAAV